MASLVRRRGTLPGVWRFIFTLVLAFVLSIQGLAPPGVQAQGLARETLADYDVVNGHFFTQAGGRNGDQGFSVTDEGGVPFWSEFRRLGGIETLGYPVSRRFVWDGFVVQATQKAVLQWRPDLGRAVFVNLLDELSQAGKDGWLATQRQIPPPGSFPHEEALSFNQIVQARLALLGDYPALRAAYLAAPDPFELNGLPVAPVADVGYAYVLRAQRRAFQLWKVATPYARAGDVTIVNGGDLGKEADLYPAGATLAEPASSQIATQPGDPTRLSADEVAALRAVIDRARPAVVRLTDDDRGAGSGIIFDSSGLILTNNHVVDALLRPAGSRTIRATLPDGRSFAARPVGTDDFTDVAVLKIDGSDLPSVTLATSSSLAIGQRVVGIGYAPVFPGAPSVKTGVVRSLEGEIQTYQDYPLFNLIATNVFLHPGDSGGPLLNLNGQVVGVNSAIQVARRGRELVGFSIPVEGARQIADQLVSLGAIPRPHLGITVEDVTPAVATALSLPVRRGVYVRQVAPDSPAAAAGIKSGDIIVGMDNREINGLDDLRRLMVNHRVGDAVPFAVVTPGVPRRSVVVTLTERAPLI